MKRLLFTGASFAMLLVTQACSNQATPLPNVQTISAAQSPYLAWRTSPSRHPMTNCSGGADTCTVNPGGSGAPGGIGGGGSGVIPCRVTKITSGRFHPDCGSGSPGGGGGGGGWVGAGAACQNSDPVNASINGQTDHNDMISAVFGVYYQPPVGVAQEIGYEYQTYGGQEYIEPWIQVSAGVNLGPIAVGLAFGGYPILSFNGSLYSAINGLAQAEHIALSSLPAPFNTITQTASMHNLLCHSSALFGGLA